MHVFRKRCGCIALSFCLAIFPVIGVRGEQTDIGAGYGGTAAWTVDETDAVTAQPDGVNAPVLLEEGEKAAFHVTIPESGTYAVRIC